MKMMTAEERIEKMNDAAYVELKSETKAYAKFRIRFADEGFPTTVRIHKSHLKFIPLLLCAQAHAKKWG